MRATQRLCALVLALLGPVFVAHPAAAQNTKASCVSAFEEGQRAQLKGELERAVEQFTQCADSACPARVRAECQGFLDTARSLVPGILLSAVDATNERPLDGVTLAIDGGGAKPYDGRMLRLQPGEHLIALERAGYAAVTLRLTLQANDAPRLVRTRFTPLPPSTAVKPARVSKSPPALMPGDELPRPRTQVTQSPLECATMPTTGTTEASASAPPPSAPPSKEPQRTPAPDARSSSGRRAAFIGAGAAGWLGAVGFAYFGLTARSADRSLDACTPNCEKSEVDTIKRDYLLANVSLAVGLMGVGAVTVLWLTAPRTEPPPHARAAPPRRWALALGPITTLSTGF